MKKNNQRLKILSKSLHDQLILFIDDLEKPEQTFIISFEINSNSDRELVFELPRLCKRFLFDQKRIISRALELNSNTIKVFIYSSDLDNGVHINAMKTLILFKRLLKDFEILLKAIYLYNEEALEAIELET